MHPKKITQYVLVATTLCLLSQPGQAADDGTVSYLYERSSTKTSIQLDKAYCVNWINASMPDRESIYEGDGGASYQCRIGFSAKPVNAAGEIVLGSRTAEYKAVPKVNFSTRRDIGTMAEEQFGYFGFIGDGSAKLAVLNSMLFAPLDVPLHGIYAALDMIGELTAPNLAEKRLELTPSFSSIIDAQEASCQVVALELVDNFCDNLRDTLGHQIQANIEALSKRSNLVKSMVPTKPQASSTK